jgi:mono/diheme cytochrome c family protein
LNIFGPLVKSGARCRTPDPDRRFVGYAAILFLAFSPLSRGAAAGDFAPVKAIFAEHCLDCHGSTDPEGKLVLESFGSLMRGGQSGPVIVPGKSAESRLIKLVQGIVDDTGKKKIMPPGKRPKLSAEQIAVTANWIDAGALPPAGDQLAAKPLVVPHIPLQVSARKPINALAYAATPNLLASATYGEVILRSASTRAVIRTLAGHVGSVNALVFSADGSQLFAAAGEAAVFGEVRQWNVSDGRLVKIFQGHHDTLYALALSGDGKTLASGGYDQKIKLWDVATARELRTLSGHNGAVFGLAFRPDGQLLASASADRTVKLWDVATGERLDTLSQPLKELYAVQFSPDGKRLFAAGAGNRIRVWSISEKASETADTLVTSQFAHEGAILRLVFSSDGKWLASSADDKSVKIWNSGELKEILSLPTQPDWPAALAFVQEDKALAVGRLDGTLELYDAVSGKVATPEKLELTRIEPRGLQVGTEAKAKLIGKSLSAATGISFDNSQINGELLSEGGNDRERWVRIKAAAELPRGTYHAWLTSSPGESAKIRIELDDLPQYAVASAPAPHRIEQIPAGFWGVHDKLGASETYEFTAKAGETLVFDVAAQAIGSKTEAVLTLTDSTGRVLAGDSGSGVSRNPLLAYTFERAGSYRLAVSERVLAASPDHYYKLSVGAFPYVTACYPLSVSVGKETEVELIGFNLPESHSVKIKPTKSGEVDLPVESARFRFRKVPRVLADDLAELREQEPNDLPSQATPIKVPGAVAGRIWSMKDGADVDLFRFEAKAGVPWIIETVAAHLGSPADTKVEVLYPDGRPVERVLLQAVRNSANTFRPIDSDGADARLENWEEMELNQYLYLQGEVVKLFRAPQGPDSGFVFYTAAGKRRTYFDTSPTSHAVDEPCYIVEPHPPGTKLVASGLPVFPVYYANDDDADRKLGTDSKLTFTAPQDGSFLIKVTDTRGGQGAGYVYRLAVREPRPDFNLTLNGANPTVNAGSGQSFSVTADRIDGFEGEIELEVTDLPPGFIASAPLVIQAGHTEALGTLFALPDAPPLSETNRPVTKIVGSALVNGKKITKDAGDFGKIRLGEKPKLYVALESAGGSPKTPLDKPGLGTFKPEELTIAPGQTLPAWLKVQRNGHDDLITFTVDNLPHGVIVDNIGLNGILIPKGENERQIFLNAAKWVPDTDRLCFAIENQAGRQTSRPVLLHVRRDPPRLSASAK